MTRKLIELGVLLMLFGASVQSAVAKNPPGDVLGVRPGMNAEEARRRLNKIGRVQTADRMKHEVWEVDDSRISYVGVRFDINTKVVRWVTAIARANATNRLRYSDMGDLKQAHIKPTELIIPTSGE